MKLLAWDNENEKSAAISNLFVIELGYKQGCCAKKEMWERRCHTFPPYYTLAYQPYIDKQFKILGW